MDLQAQKESLIERFRQINDINLIEAIQKILDYAADKEDEIYSIPEAHQKLVMERFDKIKKEPKRLIDWDKVKNTLKSSNLRYPIPGDPLRDC